MSKASEEAQKQLDRIVALGYPDVADMSAAAFRALARPLIRALEDSDLGTQILLVPTRELVSPESLIARTSINRMAGFTTMPPRDIASFLPQDGFEPPEGPFYLVVEPHTGTCYINREPDVARKLIDSDERLPLTLEEGLAYCYAASGVVVGEERFQFVGIAFRGWSRPKYLDEPERAHDWVRYGRIPVILGLATRFACLVAASACSTDVLLIFRRFSTDFPHSTDWRLSDCCDGHALRRRT